MSKAGTARWHPMPAQMHAEARLWNTIQKTGTRPTNRPKTVDGCQSSPAHAAMQKVGMEALPTRHASAHAMASRSTRKRPSCLSRLLVLFLQHFLLERCTPLYPIDLFECCHFWLWLALVTLAAPLAAFPKWRLFDDRIYPDNAEIQAVLKIVHGVVLSCRLHFSLAWRASPLLLE